jgi:hypothetical protein
VIQTTARLYGRHVTAQQALQAALPRSIDRSITSYVVSIQMSLLDVQKLADSVGQEPAGGAGSPVTCQHHARARKQAVMPRNWQRSAMASRPLVRNS